MKIAFLTQHFHPETFSNNQIARELAARGHEVHAVPCVPNYPAGAFFPGYSNRERREEVWEGVAIHRAWTRPRGKSVPGLMLNYAVYPFAAFRTLRRRIKGRPDVSFVSQTSPVSQILPAIFLRWARGTPIVCWVQDIWPESATFTLGLKNPLIVRPLRWISGWMYRRADLILVQSQAFPAMFDRFGVPRERIRFFPNTAPADHMPRRPEEAPGEAAIVPQQGFRLMFAGNIGESQDFDTLIAADQLLADRAELVWVILGDGRDRERAERLIAEKGLQHRFRFLGRHPGERMPYFFAHADAMLVSLKDAPIFALTVPYKVQGYMACAKPIVAALNGEGARIVEEAGCGVTAPASDAKNLAAAIRRMLEAGPEARTAMGQAARAWFEAHYAAQKIYDDLEGWLEEAARARAPASRAKRASEAGSR